MNEDNKAQQKQELLPYLKDHVDKVYQDSDVLDSKAQFLLGTNSLILTVAGSLQLFAVPDNWQSSPHYVLVALLTILVYVFQFITALNVLRPHKYDIPVQADWDKLMEYATMPKNDLMNQIIAQYIKAIESNAAVVSKKAERVTQISKSVGIIVVCLIGLAVIGANL